ncbi:MAG: hypothetical protein A3J09_01180 [Candidatus Zambryskibacteria bacterium RIFCSPLOWO2_02_FULL_51_21]|uniref:Uncharacterized protein n=1 Tax=Candidatus Zambryskibacteria bacterium RIFCSPHIGHO2_02_FULL_43_37 TaxID=1802749 RepID=A0A1G2TH96_9BACT|nr:MAG: hypothetical protein A2723_01180 [Candidatus Zambryskibacteria bacterium RIFCSPHIGHO2_01_FULL_52_18]OHA96572.1 MAG: hypothetical protein A3D49_01720 [Candidatus Zambryskibacteria bacterium RIFCSPHIGHO2_02_FULL_43_37]OHB07622.1 MAG: hypothetical protein A2944_00745 [Candidatus Zambryskibacteria bacterium RIFCSPLOWO2_01_FULL_52_12]OHB11164.1 MAG: hypothetical protein A3J09_01180 [Candidatus Zambryskibacteria bacterium RIFCSPLOWO2_02_FULL_51_21]
MPVVNIRYRSAHIAENEIVQLSYKLPGIVAEALTCDEPGGELLPSEVAIYPTRFSELDRSAYGLEITIELNQYESRLANLDQRAHHIAYNIRKLFNDIYGGRAVRPKAWVWVRVCPGEWVEI